MGVMEKHQVVGCLVVALVYGLDDQGGAATQKRAAAQVWYLLAVIADVAEAELAMMMAVIQLAMLGYLR